MPKSNDMTLYSPSLFERFAPPPGRPYLKIEDWAIVYSKRIIEATGRSKIALFTRFSPEYLDYYKALQEAIAKQVPNEQDRPLVVLKIQGDNVEDAQRVHIGFGGGAGPISDAIILEKVSAPPSHEEISIGEKRALIKNRFKDFSAVLYSMPPPRDLSHARRHGKQYLALYQAARQAIPCSTLLLLSNTAHSKKRHFESKFRLGTKDLGPIYDMTIVVAKNIANQSGEQKTLILGTASAGKKKLYQKLLSKEGVNSTYPKGQEPSSRMSSKQFLQHLIDLVKSGKRNELIKIRDDRALTHGEAFVNFVVEQVARTNAQILLFGCTELSMILQATIPQTGTTYKELLKEKLPKNKVYTFVQTAEKFVEIARHQVHEAQRTESRILAALLAPHLRLFGPTRDAEQTEVSERAAVRGLSHFS
jgi:aspartate/glutamate racemase